MNIYDIEFVTIEGIIGLAVALVNYYTSKTKFGYRQFSMRTIVSDSYFVSTDGTDLRTYGDSFFKSKNIFLRNLYGILFLIEIFISALNLYAGFIILILCMFILLPADIYGWWKKKDKSSKEIYFEDIMKGKLPVSRKDRLRPYKHRVVRNMTILNGLFFFVFFIILIIYSAFNQDYILSMRLAAFFDVSILIFIVGIFSPSYRDFNWLTHDAILKEILRSYSIKLRLYLDFPGAQANTPLEGEIAMLNPKLILKINDNNKSTWYEKVSWKQIKRLSVQLNKRPIKGAKNTTPHTQEISETTQEILQNEK